ncbi:MAG: hypothetical protein JRN52_06720 [Nitrososphaerota archaeon]|nr:hypothetical protein [Nitrososphaerota archaeon]
MQPLMAQEIDRLDQMDIVIGLSDSEARYLVQIWRICAQAPASSPKQATDRLQGTTKARREVM